MSYTENKTSHKNTATIIILSSVAVILVGVIGFSVFFGIPYLRYQNAVSMMEAGEYEEAMIAFYELDNFMYSKEMHTECRYRHALSLFESQKYTDAMVIFTDLGDYVDSKNMSLKCKYHIATSLLEEKKYDEAIAKFEELGDFQDSKDKINECLYQKACALLKKDNHEDAKPIFESIKKYKDSKEKIKQCKYIAAVELIDSGDIVGAYKKLTALKDYKKAKSKAKSIKPTYDRIMAKPNIFISGYWKSTYTERCTLLTNIVDDNRMKIEYSGSGGAAYTSTLLFTGNWDSSTGKLNYTDGTRYEIVYGTKNFIYGDGTGYLYFEDGYLVWVNNTENTTTRFYYLQRH